MSGGLELDERLTGMEILRLGEEIAREQARKKDRKYAELWRLLSSDKRPSKKKIRDIERKYSRVSALQLRKAWGLT